MEDHQGLEIQRSGNWCCFVNTAIRMTPVRSRSSGATAHEWGTLAVGWPSIQELYPRHLAAVDAAVVARGDRRASAKKLC
jgi:hypothetical protein